MSEPHYYSDGDRRVQLLALVEALASAEAAVAEVAHLRQFLEPFVRVRAEALELVENGFERSEIIALIEQLPDPLNRHPRYEPPLVQQPDGSWIEPGWHRVIAAELHKMDLAAQDLKAIGTY